MCTRIFFIADEGSTRSWYGDYKAPIFLGRKLFYINFKSHRVRTSLVTSTETWKQSIGMLGKIIYAVKAKLARQVGR